MYSTEQKSVLLQTARKAIDTYIASEQRIDAQTEDAALQEHCGAFVTLHMRGELRGCIGRIVGDRPLIEVVRDMAIEAATGDPRFPQVMQREMDHIDIEISVLTPLKKIDSVDEIEVGTHGLLIRKGFHSGLLLPQVAEEYGWSRDEFLAHTCRKAGMGTEEWKKDAEIYIFSAEVFGETKK